MIRVIIQSVIVHEVVIIEYLGIKVEMYQNKDNRGVLSKFLTPNFFS